MIDKDYSDPRGYLFIFTATVQETHASPQQTFGDDLNLVCAQRCDIVVTTLNILKLASQWQVVV